MAKRSKTIRNIELLAPAGGEEQLIAAVENGADAVYLGGTLFNARMNAANFDDDAMQRSLDYAHARGVRIYVTMNTLLRDDELPEALEYAKKLYAMGVDALIIQDLGLGRVIHQALPDFPLHLSTQATVSDADGVRAAQALGYKRVVLAREVSLDKLRAIHAALDEDPGRGAAPDLEVFVHGALCICYSGQCQLSRYYGGRSGNRGACAQPCRLLYTVTPASTAPYNAYALSPKDLCMIDRLGDLIEAGAASFKIEGRMKSAEYVATVTAIYRKYIDEYLQNGYYRVSDADRFALAQIFNRGGFTEGYVNGDPGRKLMCSGLPKNHGIRIGTVSFAKKGSALIDVALDAPALTKDSGGSAASDGFPLMIGDAIEIRRTGQNAQTDLIVESRMISYLKPVAARPLPQSGRRPDKAAKGVQTPAPKTVRIGDLKSDVKPGDIVFRMSSKAQLDAACSTVSRPSRKRDVDLQLFCYGDTFTLNAETVARPGEQEWASLRKVRAQTFLSAAELGDSSTTILSADRIEAQLRKTGSTPFAVRNVIIKGNDFEGLRISDVNDLRRRCLETLEQETVFRRDLPAEAPADPSMEVPPADASLVPSAGGPLPSYDALADLPGGAVMVRDLGALYRAASVASPTTPVTVATTASAETPAAAPVIADRSLNVYNRETAAALQFLGAAGFRPSAETLEPGPGFDWPVMVLEHRIDDCTLESSRGHRLRVVNPAGCDKTLIFAADSTGGTQ